MSHPLRRFPVPSPRPRAAEAPRRPRRRLGFAGRRAPAAPVIVTGRDVSSPPAPPRRRIALRPAALGTLAAGAVCAALLLVSLRMDSIRLRYALADAVRGEQELLDQQRRLIVQVRHLRDPRRLEGLAAALDLAPPHCVIDLDHPRPCPEPIP